MEVDRGSGFLPVLYRPSMPAPAGESRAGRSGEASGLGADGHGNGANPRKGRAPAATGLPHGQGPPRDVRVPPGIRELEQVQAMTGQEVMRRGGRLDLYA